MGDNVIRHDIIQLDLNTSSLKELTKINKEIDNIKKGFKGGIGDDALDDLKNGANEARKPLQKIKEQADKVKKSVTDIGKKAATTAFKGLKKLAGISFKALTVGITGAATAIGVLVKNAISAYAEYEQLYGGMQTLLGAKGAKSVEEYAKLTKKSVDDVKAEYQSLVDSENLVMKNANNAFKTAGMSANQYMETVTSFAASLKTSLGGNTAEAAKLADTAIQDMADNANKMGTPLENVSTVYSNLARGMYMTLDNLKLGYAGTKEGAMEMVNHAAKIDKSVKANDLSYANLVKAIHAVQVEMDITGTTSKEAFGTITGSLSTFKSAWANLMPAMVKGGEELDICIQNLVDSIVGFKDESTGELKGGILNNIMPAAEKALAGVGLLIEKLTPTIEKELPKIIDALLPPLLSAATALVKGLIRALPKIVSTLVKELPDILKQVGQAISEAFGDIPVLGKLGDFFKNNSEAISKFIPVLLGLVGAFAAFKKIKSIGSVFSGLLGGGKGGTGKGGKSGGLFGGLTNTFKDLAKTKPTTILKGMANLAIILGGMSAITAVMMLIAPQIAKIGGYGELLKLVGMLGVLGGVGTALAYFGGIVGKIQVTTVLKGLANMAIMLGGLSALFLLVGAISLIDFDLKRILAITGIIGVLGTVGAALSIFAGIVGLIPVPVVALGLANMAIIIGGMSALFLLIGATSLLNFDLKKITKIIGIIGLLGTVGTVLSVFAGIVGLIPIPVVLAGLTNLGLVLGGVTALIVAFGKLSEVKWFTDFLDKGGEMLKKVFTIIGEIGGSLIAGFGETVSKALPAIGENIGKFGENIKPLFSAIQGVDMGGVGTFFTSLVGLLGIATGNEIVEGIKSFFGGGDDESALAKLGTDLCAFAKNAQGFFNTVAGMNPTGFTNAKLMFESLAEVKNLPKDGGVTGWFTGNINYEQLATGLSQLGSQKVIGFFNAVSAIEQAGFDNAKLMFDTLAGMKSLPKEGGVAGWFSGEIDFTKIANGLGALGGEGVKTFFAMVGGFNEKTFNNTKKLFETLGGLENLPTEDGWWDKLWNNETTSLSDIATDLSDFATKSESFFAAVNSLNLSNLNGLWKSLKGAESLTANLSSVVDENIEDIVKKISDLPNKMGEAIKQSGESLGSAFVEVWKEAVKASVEPVNKLLSGANHILKEFGSDKKVIEWQPYAKGTNGHKGGNALVNDGRGAELVQMPNGKAFIPQGRNVFIPNAPKGMKVLNAERTAALMGRNSPTFRYANGIGDIDIWSYYDNASGLVQKIAESISYDRLSGFTLNVGKSAVSTLSGAMTDWVEKLFTEGGMSLADYNAAKGVSQWTSTVVRALKMEGQYNLLNVARTLFQMKTESGGNPKAINLWDSNAKKGIPSKGLMQVIDPTFNAYARKGFDKNIYDPLSNILASIRYAVSRYGSLAKAYRGKGYANGGIATRASIFGEDGAEMAIPLSARKRKRGVELWQQTGSILGLTQYTPEQDSGYYSSKTEEHNTYAPQVSITISGTNDDRAIARKVKRAVAEAFEEMFSTLESKTPQTQKV